MGNCLDSLKGVDNARISHVDASESDPSRATSKPYSAPSTSTTCSLPTPTVPRNTQRGSSLPTPQATFGVLSTPNLKAFTFNELRTITRNFRPDSLIGEGGFGYVFKGWLDETSLAPSRPGVGMVVAVKKLKPEGFQGHKEWLTEVHYLGQLRHPNLVKLVGYCSDGDNRLLVYEYMPKGSLENHLFRRGGQPLSWSTRIKVAIGAARGLAFLHNAENQVIYRDVKASNILLDSDFHPKLSDFGLAKEGPTGDMTHVTTQVLGTHGYAAPEYIATGHLSAKSDVYSFGVVLLELLSGRCAYDKSRSGLEQNLVDWAQPCLNDKQKLLRVIDSRLEGQYPKKGAQALASIALQCIDNDCKNRPCMSTVLSTLEQLYTLKTGKLHPTERTTALKPAKKSATRHKASPLPTPGSSPRRQTPSSSPPLRHIPSALQIQQGPRRSPLSITPAGSPRKSQQVH